MPLVESLRSSYRQTVYWVETPDRCYPLRIGQAHPEFDLFLEPFGSEWAFITACNPQSRLLTPRENRQRMAELAGLLCHVPSWPGLGVGADGEWFPEASFCVVMRAEEASRLATRFDQAAIVTGRTGAAARLIELREIE